VSFQPTIRRYRPNRGGCVVLVVIAIGGKNLPQPDQAAAALAEVAGRHHVVLTHDDSPPMVFFVHQLQEALSEEMPGRGVARLVEPSAIGREAREGTLVICGVGSALDRDGAPAVLAKRLGADVLVYLTDVSGVAERWGSRFPRPLAWATPARLRSYDLERETMGSKVESACRFVEQTGNRAAIGAFHDVAALCAGATGTQIVASGLATNDLTAVPAGSSR
jgi:carbamate kinase